MVEIEQLLGLFQVLLVVGVEGASGKIVRVLGVEGWFLVMGVMLLLLFL